MFVSYCSMYLLLIETSITGKGMAGIGNSGIGKNGNGNE